jgi:hypothetical protein
MRAEKISLTIDSICKKLGIEYCSTNPHYITLQEDIEKMSKVYLQLKCILGLLQEIEERHNLGELRNKFEILIQELEDADHDIIKLARELKQKND